VAFEGNGNEHYILISLTDDFGTTYTSREKTGNGTRVETHTIVGDYGIYTLVVSIQGSDVVTGLELTYEEGATDHSDYYVASAWAVMDESGDERVIRVSITDAFGTYEQTFRLMTNGAYVASYTVKGKHGHYCIDVRIQGNVLVEVVIIDYELDVDFDAVVYAIVDGSGSKRMVTITLTDAFGNHIVSFDYKNGSDDGIYRVATSEGEYVVYITYNHNAVQTATLVDFVPLSTS